MEFVVIVLWLAVDNYLLAFSDPKYARVSLEGSPWDGGISLAAVMLAGIATANSCVLLLCMLRSPDSTTSIVELWCTMTSVREPRQQSRRLITIVVVVALVIAIHLGAQRSLLALSIVYRTDVLLWTYFPAWWSYGDWLFRPFCVLDTVALAKTFDVRRAPHVIIVQYHSGLAVNVEHVADVISSNRAYALRHGLGFVEGSEWMRGVSNATTKEQAWASWPWLLEGPLLGLPQPTLEAVGDHRAASWVKLALVASVLQAVDDVSRSGVAAIGEARARMLLSGAPPGALGAEGEGGSGGPPWIWWLDADALLLDHALSARQTLAAVLDDDSMDRFASLQEEHGEMGGGASAQPRLVEASKAAARPPSAVDIVALFEMGPERVLHGTAAFNTGAFFVRATRSIWPLLAECWADTRYSAGAYPFAEQVRPGPGMMRSLSVHARLHTVAGKPAGAVHQRQRPHATAAAGDGPPSAEAPCGPHPGLRPRKRARVPGPCRALSSRCCGLC